MGLLRREGFKNLAGQVVAPHFEAFRVSAPDTGGRKVADDFVVGRQANALIPEDFLHRDHFAFHAGHFRDRHHAARAILKTRGLHNQVHSRRNLGSGRLLRHFDPGHGDHVFQTRHTIARRVGVDRGHRAVVAGVHGLKHVDDFFTTGFPNDDAVGTHTKRVP